MGFRCWASRQVLRQQLSGRRDERASEVLTRYALATGPSARSSLAKQLSTPVLIASYGAHGLSAYHVAVLLEGEVVLEFGIEGVRRVTLLFFLERAAQDGRRCPCVCPVLAIDAFPVPAGREARGAPWPELPKPVQRIAWLERALTPRSYHITKLNCEHFARYVVSGRAVATQGCALPDALCGVLQSPLGRGGFCAALVVLPALLVATHAASVAARRALPVGPSRRGVPRAERAEANAPIGVPSTPGPSC